MTKRFAQLAMITSWGFYCFAIFGTWGRQAFGEAGAVMDLFDFLPGDQSPPVWLLFFGFVLALAMLCSLGLSYFAVWRILKGGPGQEFSDLGRNLEHLGAGLVGLWVFWNLLTGVFQGLLASYADPSSAAAFGWNPLDIDIVFPILGISIFGIARLMVRASAAEEETRHFL